MGTKNSPLGDYTNGRGLVVRAEHNASSLFVRGTEKKYYTPPALRDRPTAPVLRLRQQQADLNSSIIICRRHRCHCPVALVPQITQPVVLQALRLWGAGPVGLTALLVSARFVQYRFGSLMPCRVARQRGNHRPVAAKHTGSGAQGRHKPARGTFKP